MEEVKAMYHCEKCQEEFGEDLKDITRILHLTGHRYYCKKCRKVNRLGKGIKR